MEWAWYVLHILSLSMYLSPTQWCCYSFFGVYHDACYSCYYPSCHVCLYRLCVCVCVCVCFGGYFCSFVFLPLLPVCCSFFVVRRVLIWKEILLAVLSLCMFEAWIASASGKGSAPGVVLTFFTACLNFFIHSPSSSGGYTQQWPKPRYPSSMSLSNYSLLW